MACRDRGWTATPPHPGSFLGEPTKDAVKTRGCRPNPAWYKAKSGLAIPRQWFSMSTHVFPEEGFSLPVKTQSK